MSPRPLLPDGGDFTEGYRKAVTEPTVERTSGCALFSSCRRDLLSFLSTTYKFVRSSNGSPTPFRSSVRVELSLFRDLMVYLESS